MSSLVEALKDTNRHIEECVRIGTWEAAKEAIIRANKLTEAIIVQGHYVALPVPKFTNCELCGDRLEQGKLHACDSVEDALRKGKCTIERRF
jgi:hypothetical protein